MLYGIVLANLVWYQLFWLRLKEMLHDRPLCVRQSLYQQSFVVLYSIIHFHSIISHSVCFIFCGHLMCGSWSSKPSTIRAGQSWWENADILKLYTHAWFNLDSFMHKLYCLSIIELFTMNPFAESSVCVSNKLANIWLKSKSCAGRHHLLGLHVRLAPLKMMT